MDTWVRFSAQTQAKERLFRAAQYACALAGDVLRRNGAGAAVLARVQQLEAHLSLGRKLVRLGSWAESVSGAQRGLHHPEPVLRFCLPLAHLTRALYCACDNLLWAGRTGLLPSLEQDKWSSRAYRYYLFSLVVSLSRDAYELQLLLARECSSRRGKSPGILEQQQQQQLQSQSSLQLLGSKLQLLLLILRNNPPLLLDLLRNVCDLLIPLDKLGLVRSSPALVGLCGLVSSLLSILSILHPWLQLKP